MSLFERLKDKRHNLQEKPDPIEALRKAIRDQEKLDAAKGFQKDVGKEITPELKKDLNKQLKTTPGNRFFTDKPDSETLKTKPTGDEGSFRRNANKSVVNRQVKKTIPGKSKKISVSALDKRDAAIKKLDQVVIKPKPGEVSGTKKIIKNIEKDLTKPKEGEVKKSEKIVKRFVKQSEQSKKAKEFTDKINQKNKNYKSARKSNLSKKPLNVRMKEFQKLQRKIDAANPVEIGKAGKPVPVKGTVLKVSDPSKVTGGTTKSAMQQGAPKGFERVLKTSKKSPDGLNPKAKEIMSKQVSTDDLLSGNKKIEKKYTSTSNFKDFKKDNKSKNNYKKEYKKAFNNKGKSGKTLFQRIKDIGRKSKEYLGKAHQFMIKDHGFRKTSKFPGYDKNITRNTFKNTIRGNTMRRINKILPGKYKALAAIAAGTYLATRGKKNAGAGSGDGKPKVYDAYQKTLGFDTGKKKEP